MKITKGKIFAVVLIIAILILTYVWGGGFAKGSPSSDVENNTEIEASQELDSIEKDNNDNVDTLEKNVTKDVEETAKNITVENTKKAKKNKNVAYSESKGMDIDSETGKDKYLTDPVPEGKPIPVEPGAVDITNNPKTCTLSIECKTILDNMGNLDKEKVELVPEDGIILAATTVTFYEGESVFNLLQRETKKNKIHMEFSNTPIYNSAYIEGIHNLYEFDCGELSGWMYKVNGWYPNYGCSRYVIKDGDVIEWVYTCDLGRDIGGGFDEK